MKRVIFICIYLSASFLLKGCISSPNDPRTPISINNYKQKIVVTRSSKSFHFAKYTGDEIGCFPPTTGRDCSEYTNNNSYENLRALDIKKFSIQASNANLESRKYKEFLNMMAADISLQEGYKYFSVLENVDVNSCGMTYSANTYGTSYGNAYSSTTTLSPSAVCAAIYSIDVIAFNSPKELADGVFYREGDVNKGSAKYRPYKELYFGSMVGLRPGVYNNTRSMDSGDSSTNLIKTTRTDAWKNYFEAAGVSRDYHSKLGLADTGPIVILDESSQQTERKANDIMERNKVIR